VTVDFAALAADYDRLRPRSSAPTELGTATFEHLRGCRRLIDVGCGTGQFAVSAANGLGARVWGVDPSAEMLEQARARPGATRVGWRRAAAERLPFKDAWFDAAHAHLVVHLLPDRGRALGEMARVLSAGGRLVIVTFELDHFERFFLNPYFPSIPAIDRERFPDPELLLAELGDVGFTALQRRRVAQPVSAGAPDVLERVRGRYISTLHLIDPAEYRRGLTRLEADVAGGTETFEYSLQWSLITATRAR
jgi:SAM-dependent methyltransferase